LEHALEGAERATATGVVTLGTLGGVEMEEVSLQEVAILGGVKQ